MGERKVLNKNYPPDFDIAKIPHRRQPKNQQIKVRMMLPIGIRCGTCGNYIYKGTKFNSCKEDVIEEVIDEEKKKRNAEEMGDAMKSLENRTLDSNREMDILATLDEMKSMKCNAMLEALQRSNEAKERKLEEEDEALIKVVFKPTVIRRIDDEDIDDEEYFPMFPFNKEGTSADHSKRRKVSEKPYNPTDSLTNGTVLDSSSSKG
ncbi:Hypothetical predicted protein, partial [Olea europaea subsp. europaea]